MAYSLSTTWLARRHSNGAALVDEVAALGFDALELGYFIREEMVPAILQRVDELRMHVSSIHAFAPVAIGTPMMGPELFSLAEQDEEARRASIFYLKKTLDLARESGAAAVVLHGGRVQMKKGLFRRPYDSQLIDLYRRAPEAVGSEAYQGVLAEERLLRARAAGKTDAAMRRSLDEVLPLFEAANVRLCLENLPGLEAYPDVDEFLALKRDYPTEALGYWHDIGHGELKHRYGDVSIGEALDRQLPFLGGIHIHDVTDPDQDHQAPGSGGVDFEFLRMLHEADVPQVFEPSSRVSAEALRAGLAYIRKVWDSPRGEVDNA